MRSALLDEDADLARRIPESHRRRASESLQLAVARLDPGEWRAPAHPESGQVAFILLNGKLLREVRIHRRWNAELLLGGDLIRPWLEDSASFADARWVALEPCRLGIVDHKAMRAFAEWPSLLDALFERALRRSRTLATHAAIESVQRVDQRLLLLFWHLAERCGGRRDGRPFVRIPLTHDQLARLVGAERPTVTTALTQLARRGALVHRGTTWLLGGKPPAAGEIT